MPKKTASKKGFKDQPKLSKAQIRRIPELQNLYRMINEYSLREEAYAVVLQSYIQLKKNK